MPITPLSYLDFKREMAFDLHWGDLETLSTRELGILHTLLQSAVRKVFFPLRPGTSHVHEWSWASPLRSLIVRTEVTGTLLVVPARAGELIILTAAEAIFDSDLVGHDLTFDTSGQRFTIVEFSNQSTVKVRGSDRSDFGQATQLGDRQESTVASLTADAAYTVITNDSTDDGVVFHSSMVGDTMVVGSNSYLILVVVLTGVDLGENPTRLFVQGDASAETAAMTIDRRRDVLTNIPVSGSASAITCVADSFRGDMVSSSDTIVFVDDATVYTIVAWGGGDGSGAQVQPDASGEGVTADIDIKKSFGTDYTPDSAIVSVTNVSTQEADVFVASDEGQYVVFIGPLLNSYKINEFVTDQFVKVDGDATGEVVTTLSIVRTVGALDSTARTFNGTSTLLTADAAIFTAAMVGLVIEFPKEYTGRELDSKYVITEFVGTTSVRVAGDATQEGGSFPKFLVVGPSDLAADDAFTVLNTGADYELPEDFGGLDGPLTFSSSSYLNTIEITGESTIRNARQRLESSGVPQLAAIRPVLHDGRFTQRYELMLWPGPSGTYTLNYKQIVVLPEITESEPFPPGGAAYGELYLAACLALAEQRISDRRGLRWEEYQERLAAMIEVDGIATGAETLGIGHEDGRRFFRTIPQTLSVTYVPGA